MTSKEWLSVMQQAEDFNHALTPLIIKYGELLLSESHPLPASSDKELFQWVKVEEALKQIEQMSDCGDAAVAVVRMKQIARTALSTLSPVQPKEELRSAEEIATIIEKYLVLMGIDKSQERDKKKMMADEILAGRSSQQTGGYSREDMEQCHMNGQKSAGCKEPSYNEARAYVNDVIPPPSDLPVMFAEYDHGKCMEKNCTSAAVKDYNGHGHWVCNKHYDKLNDEFDEEYK